MGAEVKAGGSRRRTYLRDVQRYLGAGLNVEEIKQEI